MVILELGSLPHLPRNFSELVPKSHDLQNSFGFRKMAQQLKTLAALPEDRSLISRAHTVAHKTTCDPSPWPPWVHMLYKLKCRYNTHKCDFFKKEILNLQFCDI